MRNALDRSYRDHHLKEKPQIAIIVNPQINTGLCHYLISVSTTSVVGNKRELKVMKSSKYKFSSDSYIARRDTIYKNFIFCANFVEIFIGLRQFLTYFQNVTAHNSGRELGFCTIVPYSSKNFLHIQTESECLRKKLNTQQRTSQN